VARYDLGINSDEFYSLTPRQLDALVKRHERATQEREFLFAQMTSCIVNFSMARPKEPASAADFMPSEWTKKRRSPSSDPTDAEQQMLANQLRGMFDALMKRGEKK
jgi:hypothetical protein